MASGRCVRVGRRVGTKDPKLTGYISVVCLTPSTKWGSIGPYCLKDHSNRIMENVYQSSKVYVTIPKTRQVYSRWDSTTTWERDSEVHVVPEKDAYSGCIPIKHPIDGIDGKAYLTPEYMKWRHDLEHNPYPVRYPVGMKWRGKCIGALSEEELTKYTSGTIQEVSLLDYVSSRREIYVPTYENMIRSHPDFKKLLEIARKNNILIIEVDGPHGESIDYYVDKYQVSKDFIVDSTIEINPRHIEIMIGDQRHPYGHGYVLGNMIYNELRR